MAESFGITGDGMGDKNSHTGAHCGSLPEHVELLTNLLESARDIFWSTSIDGKESFFINSAVERIYERPVIDFVQNPRVWYEAIHPDDLHNVKQNLMHLPENRQIEQEFRIIRPNGEIRWLRDRVSVVYDDDGNPIRLCGVTTDISRRMEAELERELANRAMRDSEALYHSLVDHLPIYVTRIDLDGRITYVNKNYCELIGLPPDQILGKTNFDFHPPEYAKKYREDELRVAATGEVFTAVEENRRGDDIGYFEVRKAPVRNGRGEVIEIQAVFWDVTERHHAEIKRLQAETAVREAKDAAENANRAKSDFLANMSHEIRTPMNAIIGMTELVLGTELDNGQRDYLNVVSDSAESLLTIINQILDFSKIEAGKLELETLDFNLRDEIGDALKSIAQRAHSKGIELAWRVDSAVPEWLQGDPARLRQILINLTSNAIKFTEEGEVLVDVACQSVRDSQFTLQFKVKDTGIGISAENQASIFREFEQADSSTTREFGGTGLGLAITTRIVEAMDGHIWVESALGKGSTFHFTVAFERSTQPPIDQDQLPNLNGVPVIVVDDNETNRLILQEMLQNWGMTVKTVEGGAQAVAALQQTARRHEKLPLVITDVNMPEMDGFTLVGKLRAVAMTREAVIIMLTSGSRRGDIQRCQELEIRAHLMKPVKQSELLEAIMAAAGGQTLLRQKEKPSKVAAAAMPIPRMKILLAEDGKANQMMAMGLLKTWGHEVVVAENGEQAIICYQNEPFDLILMDVQMPVMDGLEATRRIRKLERGSSRRIPIVAMTARVMKGDREICFAAGMDGYLSKPARAAELAAALKTHCESPDSSSNKKVAQSAADVLDVTVKCLVNWSIALEVVDGQRDILKSVVEAVLEEIPELIQQIQSSLNTNDCKTLRRAAHTIGGTMRTFDVSPVIELASALEELGRSEDLTEAAILFGKLQDELSHVLNELRSFET